MSKNNRIWLIVVILSIVGSSIITYNFTSDVTQYKTEIKSKKLKERYDSTINVYSKQIDSLKLELASIDTATKVIDNRISNRKQIDSLNYEAIITAHPDSAYNIVKQYLDSALSVNR